MSDPCLTRRSLAQLRADLAIDLITGTHHQSSDDNHDTGDEEDDGRPAGHEPTDQPGADHDDEPAHDTDTSAEAPSADSSVGRPGELVPGVPNPDLGHGPRRPSEVQVVIGADSLFGGGREPAMIRGYGSISPHLGCYLAGSDKVWLRQLVADPCDGHLLAMSTRTRLFRGELRKFLTWRDQTCAINTCGRPGEHADHVTPHALGGPTSAEDGQMLCSGDNFAKEHPDVVVTRNPDDSTTWRMPTGHEYTQHPPPVLGFGTGDPPRHRLYELFAEDQGDTDDLSPPF
jgi:hypothetical protein